MPKLLLIVDVQRGFINGGTAHVPARVTALQKSPGYDAVIATRFINPEGTSHRKFIHWSRFAPGSPETELAFRPAQTTAVVEKTTYTCVNQALLHRLRTIAADEVHLCGIATDNCILITATDLFEAGVRPVVLSQACASHAGRDYHEWGLRFLRRLLGSDQVVDHPIPLSLT